MNVFQFQFPVDMVVLGFQPKLAANQIFLAFGQCSCNEIDQRGYKFDWYLNCNSEDVFEKI